MDASLLEGQAAATLFAGGGSTAWLGKGVTGGAAERTDGLVVTVAYEADSQHVEATDTDDVNLDEIPLVQTGDICLGIDWGLVELDLVTSLAAACRQLHGSKQPVPFTNRDAVQAFKRTINDRDRLSAVVLVAYEDDPWGKYMGLGG